MKKLFVPLLVVFLLPLSFSCSTAGNLGGYTLTERDASNAIRQLLEAGTRENVFTGAFSKDMILTTLFPEPVKKALNTLQQLGLTNEVDRFTTTLSTASEKTAEASVPIFVDAIHDVKFVDAVQIIKRGGTAATDYLRSSAGENLRHAIIPVMQASINEYHLNEQWNKIIAPAKTIAGNKLNLDLATLMAGAVSEAMFRKIAEKETQVRTDATARSTPLLQKVFSRDWSLNS